MNLLRIAARVASVRVAVPTAGGGEMEEPNWASVESTLLNEFKNAVITKGVSILFEGHEPWTSLWGNLGIGVSMTETDGDVGISVHGEGDTDLIGTWPLNAFDEAVQAEAASLAIRSLKEFFHGE